MTRNINKKSKNRTSDTSKKFQKKWHSFKTQKEHLWSHPDFSRRAKHSATIIEPSRCIYNLVKVTICPKNQNSKICLKYRPNRSLTYLFALKRVRMLILNLCDFFQKQFIFQKGPFIGYFDIFGQKKRF